MRKCGILLHITSLDSPYGIGDFGQSARRFVDFLKESKQTYWQILPLGYVGYGYSPYQSYSAYAMNPYLIDISEYLTVDELSEFEIMNTGKVDFERVVASKDKAFRKIWGTFDWENEEYVNFKAQQSWLHDFAVFITILKQTKQGSLKEFPVSLLYREADSLCSFEKNYQEDIEREKMLQYIAYSQWFKLKVYANQAGIQIVGDMPIYVSFDSAEVWSERQLFQIEQDFSMLKVAGVPPDRMCEDGQVWGNPLYDWTYMRAQHYAWWISRIEKALNLYDVVRIDHFRGFASYFEVYSPFTTAKGGSWQAGFGRELFQLVNRRIDYTRIIAEDLGLITKDVKQLLRSTKYAGMRVLQFGMNGQRHNPHYPKRYPHNCIAYTGTHDNDTLMGWYGQLTDTEKQFVDDQVGRGKNQDDPFALIDFVMRSRAKIVMIPLQDYLGLGSSARMNTPSTVGCNWTWRNQDDLKNWISKISRITNDNQRG